MKLKAVVDSEMPQSLVSHFESRLFRDEILTHVLKPGLHVGDNFGPAEFYIQHCDLAESKPMCEVRLTGVSVTRNRSTEDFYLTRKALEQRYAILIEKALFEDQKCQLMTSLMLDQTPFGEKSSLIEGPAVWVQGKKKRK